MLALRAVDIIGEDEYGECLANLPDVDVDAVPDGEVRGRVLAWQWRYRAHVKRIFR